MLQSVILFLATVGAVSATAIRPGLKGRSSNCTDIAVRPEWKTLTTAEQYAYLDAELCLMSLPAQSTLAGVTNRYTDLVALHQNLSDSIHNVGQFLPWHRYFLNAHEVALRTQCNYTGSIPWWDERADAGAFGSSSVFSADTFGSDSASTSSGSKGGSSNSGVCVTDGYFANLTLYIGPGTSDENTEHCLYRNLNEQSSAGASTDSVDSCNSSDNYTTMWECVFPGPHGSGHSGVGGIMLDTETSPGDPIFWLHHGFIDRNWWTWQQADVENRLYQMNGASCQKSGGSGPGGSSTSSTTCDATTLDYVLFSWDFLPNVTVNDVMDTQGGYLCYVYDD